MRQEGGGSREFKLHSVGVHHLVRELDTSRGCGGIDGYPRLKGRILTSPIRDGLVFDDHLQGGGVLRGGSKQL